MKTLDFLTLLSVFQEMLGVFLWILLILIIGSTLAFVALIVRERGIDSFRLVRAEVAGIFGGFLALVIMAKASASGFTDAGGPIDWFLIAIVFGLGLIGGTILVYTILGYLSPRR